MGSFLQSVAQIQQQESTLFYSKINSISEPIQKIKEYYGLFKSVCDSFLITKDKYIEIFQSIKNLEEIWDKQKNYKIDALQLFSGLIAYSKQSSFKQKLKFWFMIFDFNQIKKISFIDLEYLTLCICNATFKIINKNAKANQTQIVQWLKKSFSQHTRIHISKLYSFCIQSPQIKRFFQIITKQSTSNHSLAKQFALQEQIISEYISNTISWNIPYRKQSSKQLQEKLQWHRNFSKRLSTPYNPTNYLYSTHISWVYGIRVQNLINPFILISDQMHNQQQILYSTSTLMILYNKKTNSQRYYNGHHRLISAFVYNSTKEIIISASDSICMKSIHIWDYRTLNCIKILNTYKPVKSLTLLGKQQQMLIVCCGQNQKVLGNQKRDTGSTIMIYSLQQSSNYALIHSFTYEQKIKQIVSIYTNIHEDQVMMNIWNSFVLVCENSNTVILSEFQCSLRLTNQQNSSLQINHSQLKNISYEFYQEIISQEKQKQDYTTTTENRITSCIALYLNQQNPFLRAFITSEQTLSLIIITGHQNGQLKCVTFNDQQFSSQDIIFEANKKQSKDKKNSFTGAGNQKSQTQHKDKKGQFSISCISHTDSHIIFSYGSFLTFIPFSYLFNKKNTIRSINILDYPELKLFNSNIKYFAHSEQSIILVTQNQGDFLFIKDRRIMFNQLSFTQKQSIQRIKTLTKIQGNTNTTMCLLEKVENQHLIYLTTQDRKILIINSFSKQIQNVWEVNSPGDHITAIDAVYTDEDILYFVCGCKQGKLYIRVDNQENPKYYDCVSQIVDIKISKDASYLLVATKEKYLYFFTQINKNFTSPRKLHFENQIPLCINFLDSNKLFTVNTSAKNVYMIEIPQLKHRNVQKQNEKINISKMKIVYPSYQSSYAIQPNNKTTQNQLKKQTYKSQKSYIYSKTYLGGQLKYFMMTLHSGQILFFQSRNHLQNLSYINLKAHWGEISNISIAQEQDKFYTLGKYDNTLIEWSPERVSCLENIPQNVKMYSQKTSLSQLQEFSKMKQISLYYKLINSSKPEDIYLFRGTNNQKLNESLKKSLSRISSELEQSDQEVSQQDSQSRNQTTKIFKPYSSLYKLSMRQPNLSLQMSSVIGLQCYKGSSVVFWGQNSQKCLYHSSRFLLTVDPTDNKKQTTLQQKRYKISCFIVAQDQKILFSLIQPKTKIYIHGEDQHLITTHQLGIIHFATHESFILSYGILKNSYSINIHNYRTKQLIAHRTTDITIHCFIFLSKDQFVSLKQIRIWDNLYPSQKIGKASAGILMPNKRDICLGTDNGSISILNLQKGIFTVVTKAHQSDITFFTINRLENGQKFNNHAYQLLTISKDDKIKIWNQKFSCKLMINLRQQLLKNIHYLVQTEQERRNYMMILQNISKDTLGAKENIHNYRSLNIRGMDSRQGKILVYLASGQVFLGKFTILNRQNQLQKSIMDNQSNHSSQNQQIPQSNQSIFKEMQKRQGRRDNIEYEKQWEKIIQSHSCQTNSIFKKFIHFTVHPNLPILASVGGNDKKILFRDYQTSQILTSYYSQESRIKCLKFSKKGHLIAFGFKNGVIKLYSIEAKYKEDVLKHVDLYFSQKFVIKQDLICQPINIQFSQKSHYFAVSFIGQKPAPQINKNKEEQLSQDTEYSSFVQIFKQKSQQSQQVNESEQIYFSLIDTINIKNDDSFSYSSSKYIKCVHNMKFVEFMKEGIKQKQNNVISNGGNICLVMFQQYMNQNHIRINNSQKDKFLAYIIQEKSFVKKQFDELDWTNIQFPQLVNVLQLNRFKTEILFLSNDQESHDINQNLEHFNEENNDIDKNKFQQNPLSMTAMCYYKKNFIIYGGTHGKIHLIRTSSLLTDKNAPLQDLKQQEMAISKTYVSQTSFINQLEVSNDYKYLFVAGQIDECIVKYKISELPDNLDLDYQNYDTFVNDPTETFTSKQKFYSFINSVMPLREQIKNVLEDVENFDKQQKQEDQVGLEVIKMIGRRAYDRCNNIFLNQDNLIYTVGPNLIIQNIIDTFSQKVLPSDPNNLSYSPQISTINMIPNSNILILATQEQASRLFIWDIRAQTCLSQMQINCSIIYNIKLIGDKYAVFYGVNSLFQLVIQVVDWKNKKIVALTNLLHTSTWKIRDMIVLQQQNTQIVQNNIKFVTCGIQHLSEWNIKTNALIQTHFNNIPEDSSFYVINHLKNDIILTGCQKGNIFVWKNKDLIQKIKIHSGPIRSLQTVPQNNVIITGGIDSFIQISRFQDDQISVQCSKPLNPKVQDINSSNIDQSVRGQKQILENITKTFLTEFDIQSIVYSPLRDTSKSHRNSNQIQECNFFVGTRSGDIYFCEYSYKQKQFISTTHLVYGQDHQTIVSTCFSAKEQILYTLTTSGKLEVWDLKMFQKVFVYKFMKKAKKLYVYKQYLLICFQKDIIFIEIDIRDKITKIDEGLGLRFDGIISECVLSQNQCYLSIGLHKNESNQILIYELQKRNLIYHSPSLKYEIQFLDFSTDQKYLLYKDKFEEIGMIYLVTLKRINTIFVQMKIEWQTEGLRISPKAQKIYCSYNCQNRITTICKFSPNYILVGDEMGTLRIFPYPPENDRLGQLHVNCYAHHMNKINSIQQHKQLTYVATTAVYDRSLIIWRKYGIS